MTEDEVRDIIRTKSLRFARNKGTTGVTAWGKAHNIKRGHLSEFMNSRRGPVAAILDALNLEWRICRKRHRKDLP